MTDAATKGKTPPSLDEQQTFNQTAGDKKTNDVSDAYGADMSPRSQVLEQQNDQPRAAAAPKASRPKSPRGGSSPFRSPPSEGPMDPMA